MHILYLHQYFVPRQGHGGTRSYEFAQRLLANGHEVSMITSSAMIPDQYGPFDKTTHLKIDGIAVTVIPVDYSNKMSYPQRIRAFFKFALLASREATRHRADLVFATSTPLTIAIPGIIAKWLQRIPLVLEVRDLWPELPIAMGALENPVAKTAARKLEWVAYHNAKHIIALSPGMVEGIARRGIPKDRITMIPNACDIDLFDVPPERGQAIRDQLELQPSQPLLVYAGTFGLINGVGYLVDIAAAARRIAPDLRFLVIGDGTQRGSIRDRAEALGVLGQNLWLWEPVPKEKLVDVLAAATIAFSVFVPLKAMWHNSANKFFDALAAGKPVVINYGGWQADLLNETGAGLVLPPDQPTQAAHQLAAFVQDRERLKKAREASRNLAHTRFSRDNMAHKLETVFLSVLKESQR